MSRCAGFATAGCARFQASEAINLSIICAGQPLVPVSRVQWKATSRTRYRAAETHRPWPRQFIASRPSRYRIGLAFPSRIGGAERHEQETERENVMQASNRAVKNGVPEACRSGSKPWPRVSRSNNTIASWSNQALDSKLESDTHDKMLCLWLPTELAETRLGVQWPASCDPVDLKGLSRNLCARCDDCWAL